MMLEAAPDQRWPMLLMAAIHLQTRRRRRGLPGRARGAAGLLPDQPRSAAGDDSRPQHPDQRGGTLQLPAAVLCGGLRRPPAGADRGRSEPRAPAQPRPLRLRLRRGGGRRGRLGADPLLRVAGRAPSLQIPPIASRVGIDLAPCCDDEWLRACAFADQPERLSGSTRRWRSPASTRRGCSRATRSSCCPELVAEAPPGAQVVVFHTAVLAYLPEGAPERLREIVGRDGLRHRRAQRRVPPFVLETDGEVSAPHTRTVAGSIGTARSG